MNYLNPVYPHDFPDPFILKVGHDYWAYCTGMWHDGRCFGILHSRDLVTWEVKAGAMAPLPTDYPHYWAPEVTLLNGQYYLYYSVGDEATMQIRVAVATRPDGPFEDSGYRLTTEPFAIDAHVFVDRNGWRHLFYATDFLEHTHIGTGTMRDDMRDPFSLTELPTPVTRAKYDWQVYDPERAEKGGVRWHTVEGPFVLYHKGLYYQMFSGGNWQEPSYGVSYATSPLLDTYDEWAQVADGESVLPILRSDLEKGVIGPGHNSVVVGPDNRQLYCVYHRWAADGSGRQLAIDPLEFVGERMVLSGPSTRPQPAPLQPTFTAATAPWQWQAGVWGQVGEMVTQASREGRTGALWEVGSAYFLLDVRMRRLTTGYGAYGVRLLAAGEQVVAFLFDSLTRRLLIMGHTDTVLNVIDELEDFDPLDLQAWQQMRVEVNGRLITFTLPELGLTWQGQVATAPTALMLATEAQAVAFSHLSLTLGWEDDFMLTDDPDALGWEPPQGVADSAEGPLWVIRERELQFTGEQKVGALVKGDLHTHYEVVVNARFSADAPGHYAIAPATYGQEVGRLLLILHYDSKWYLSWREAKKFQPLPDTFDPMMVQQFRFRRTPTTITAWWENQFLGEVTVTPEPTRIALEAGGPVAFEYVRLTVISDDQE